jgi:iron complex outermembrane receptor protein
MNVSLTACGPLAFIFAPFVSFPCSASPPPLPVCRRVRRDRDSVRASLSPRVRQTLTPAVPPVSLFPNQTMKHYTKHSSPPLLAAIRLIAAWAFSVVLASVAVAQSSQTGSIIGRVLNPATGEYIRNAEVRVEGTRLSVFSGDGGYYELFNVPAGEVTVTATYTGHETATAKVSVTTGSRATRDFELAPSRQKGDETVQLNAFVVSEEREGQAKAVAEQKQAMNVKTVMSADNFGDMSEGNIGEFLKYMPGITLDYVETDTRAARMGGMDAKYGYVTLDGNTMASGNSGGFGDDTRQFEFESISMNNIESIEVNKTLSADMSGDAPAGTINLRTRSALDRKQAKYGFTLGLIGNSYEHSIKRTPRHDDGLHAKTRPRFSFDYTNSFLDHKLGITLNGAFTNIYKEQFRESLGYDYTSTTAVAAGHPLINSINFKDGPKIVEKHAGGIKIDYQPIRGLRMSGAFSYSWFNDFFANRNLNFVTSSALLDPASNATTVIAKQSTNTNTRVDQSGTSDGKLKDSTNLSYGVNYKKGPWTTDLTLLYSRQREHRGGLAYNTLGAANVRLTRIGWTATRSSIDSPNWYFTQTAGPDWFDWSKYGSTDTQTGNTTGSTAYGQTVEYTGKLDFKRVMPWEHPTSYKFGFSDRVSARNRKQIDSFTSTYTGPTGNQLTSPMPQSLANFQVALGWGGNMQPLPVPDKEALAQLRFTHPEYFTRTEANLATDLDNLLGSYQANQEEVRALYLMQETRIGKWRFQAGLRQEMTNTISKIPYELPANDNQFATKTVNGTTGVTTFNAVSTRQYIYEKWSKGTTTTYGSYDDWLPSASAKWQITKDLSLKFGYNKAIKRPNLNRIAGQWDITTNSSTGDVEVTIPNPGLRPERSQKYSVMLEYYFEPACTVSAHVFQTDIKGASDETDPISAADFGVTDPFLQDFFFTTFVNLSETRRVRGIELSYSQQLTFFRSEWLRGISVFGTYSQYMQSPRPRNAKFFPRNFAGGVTWKYRDFVASVNGTWTDETFTGSNSVSSSSKFFPSDNEYLKPRTILFVSAQYRLPWKGLSVFVSGDRAYDSGKTWFFKSDGRIRQMERYGSQWSVGLRGDY